MFNSTDAVVFVLAIILELLLGDPVSRWHPVALFGSGVANLVARAPRRGPARSFVWGAAIVFVAVAGVGLGAALVLAGLEMVSPGLALVCGAILCKVSFSYRQLEREVVHVAQELETDNLTRAREVLRALVSRDPSTLTPTQVASAAIESLAENLSDSLVAPLFYFVLFGVPGALAYRAVNTLDAMIGYRGELEYLGRVAARLDDAANFVPARLTAGLLVVAAALARQSWRGAAQGVVTYHGRTASPNAGWPMAAMAGGLGVELEKPGHHRLGPPGAILDAKAIRRAVSVARWVAVASAFLGLCGALL